MRASPKLSLRDGDKAELVRLATDLLAGAAVSRRARIVLLAAKGHTNAAIAARTGASLPTVVAWRSRYQESGIPGLSDGQRSGRPRRVDRESIIKATVNGSSQERPWTCRNLARHLGVSSATVARCWREFGIAPRSSGGFRFHTEPQLEASEVAVIGQLEGEGGRMVVLLVDQPGDGLRVIGTSATPTELVRDCVHRYSDSELHVVTDGFARVALRRSAASRTWWDMRPSLRGYRIARNQSFQLLVQTWRAFDRESTSEVYR